MTRPRVLGLTGSIGMGKSTTARMFADAGIEVWDADAAVHRLYDHGGAAVPQIAALCPAVVVDGKVDRNRLKDWLRETPDGFERLEAVVHPLVAADRAAFLSAAKGDFVVADIPLLFETGGIDTVDRIAVVSVPAEVQKARVMARPGMTIAQFEAILSRQMPDAEKRARADYLIDAGSMETARADVRAIIDDMRRLPDA